MNVDRLDFPLNRVKPKFQVPTVKADTPIFEVANLLRETRCGSVVILNGSIIEGIFTEKDYIVKIAGLEHELSSELINKFMISNPVTASPKSTVREAIETMQKGGFRSLVLVDLIGKFLNVVTMQDIVNFLFEE